MRTDFDTQIADRLGAAPTMTDFDPSDLTPDCIYYEDDETSCQEGSPDGSKSFIVGAAPSRSAI